MTDTSNKGLQLSALLILVVGIGTVGYAAIDSNYSLIDALYMTVITITTVGFGETHDLSQTGRIFTIFLIALGWMAVALFASHFARAIIGSEVRGMFARKKILRRIKRMKNHYIICGYGRIGSAIAQALDEKGISFVAIEQSDSGVALAEERGFHVIKGDATCDLTLKHAGVANATGVVAALQADKDNLFISLAARELNPSLLIISRGEEPGVEDRILRAGADIVVSPMQLGGQQIAELIFEQNGSSLDAPAERQPASILGFDLRLFKNSGTADTTVAAMIKDADALAAVVVKREGGDTAVSPAPETIIAPGDCLVMLVNESSESSGPSLDHRGGELILLADDHAALRKLFAKKLRAAGHKVITARDGEEALRLAREYSPDLIVLDVTMPGKSGYEICEVLKQQPAHRDTPVILYSATEHHEFHERGKVAGADACLFKTSRSSELIHKIEELLSAHGITDAPIIDQARIDEASGGDRELQKEIGSDFLLEFRKQFPVLTDALERRDAEGTLHELHNIKGAALNIGFMEIGTIAAQMEEEIQAGDLEHCRQRLDSLTEALARLAKELQPLARLDAPAVQRGHA